MQLSVLSLINQFIGSIILASSSASYMVKGLQSAPSYFTVSSSTGKYRSGTGHRHIAMAGRP